MKKPNVTKLIKSAKTVLGKHSPEILTGIGIAGMVTTVVLAVKATPKALEKIEEKKKDIYDELDPLDIPSQAVPEDLKLTKAEVVKATWKLYVPAAVTGAASAACLIGASKVNLKRNAALATAYNLSQTALNEYKAKVIETIGEEKEKVIREKVAQERIDKNPVSSKEVIITGNGNFLCFDPYSGRYFESDHNAIEKAVNKLNRELNMNMYVSLNDLYNELGLRNTELGDLLGWNIDNGLIEVDMYATLGEKDEPCLGIEYNIAPRYDYSKLM